MDWYVVVLKKYADFTGRARRREYWMFTLINVLVGVAIWMLGMIGGTLGSLISALGLLYSLAVLVPGIAVSVRRLHDTGRSGWTLLLALVPLVSIVLLVFLCQDGTAGDNRYGSNPRLASFEALAV
jgi:uncharacterized membrane protein YhaH (DUF805 family)